jgi:5-methyltetrahydropteroyltriglutamate--homocysteine methyltransferase
MYKASAGITLPTSIIGSLPRPSWYTAGLGSQSFLEAMMNLRYREQYEDAVSVYLRAQETAGLDICTDGDAHFDEQISGMSWQSYPLTHMAGFSTVAEPSAYQLARSMTGNEFLRRIKRLGRERGVAVRFEPRHGKGSHGTLHTGATRRR